MVRKCDHDLLWSCAQLMMACSGAKDQRSDESGGVEGIERALTNAPMRRFKCQALAGGNVIASNLITKQV